MFVAVEPAPFERKSIWCHTKYLLDAHLLESEDEVGQFVQQGGYSWTFVIDTTGEVTASYNITAIPTSFFIDREGIIRAVNIGATTKRAVEAKLDKAMR